MCGVKKGNQSQRIFLRFEEMLWTGKEAGIYLPEADLDAGHETQLDRRRERETTLHLNRSLNTG
jgi:hypothetical protein